MNQTQPKPITVLLDRNAHRYARQFAAEQSSPVKGKQVYLNTLIVYGVHTYLNCLNINNNIADSDSWQRGVRAMFDVADIVLPNGKLECLVLLPTEKTIEIPLEARENRLGYIVGQFEEELKEIKLLGFISPEQIKFNTETLDIAQIKPLEKLFDAIANEQQTNLSQWLQDIFTTEWQPIEAVLAGRITRSLSSIAGSEEAIARGKIITWQIDNLEREIILVLKIIQSSDSAIDLCLQLYPGKAQVNLPPGLSVSILDETNQPCLSAQTKDADDWMQLEFSCHPGEEFQVVMNLAGVSKTISFCI